MQNHLLTIMDQTLVKVQPTHDTNDEANENKKRGIGGRRAKETPLTKSPSKR